MDLDKPGQENYNGGIIFVSYLVSVIGAMTTLELLQRRTHIRGHYNWFLLFAAAISMGGVGIWCMHFIGNNSLTITFDNGDKYQLSYSPGFTFTSLIVAILVMFLAFAFVGITEEAEIKRILPSGILAGLGIVCMHYLGQVAVDFFRMKNRMQFAIAATVIAICAVTAALFIFFKLREQWANQWYKRLGCAMIMAVAACGMHYTAMVGTLYYPGASNSGPPTPVLGYGALIGIISGIVIVSCIVLFAIGAKASFDNHAFLFQANTKKKRLILDTVYFDTNGRVLVKVDGIVPMKEILSEIPEHESYGFLTTSHPLFTRLFETTIQWAKSRKSNDDEETSPFHSTNNTNNFNNNADLYSLADDAFLKAANELVEELRVTKLSDLGHLFDSILYTNTISKKSLFSQEPKSDSTTANNRRSNTASWLLSSSRIARKESSLSLNIEDPVLPITDRKKNSKKSLNRSPSMASQVATVIDIFNNATPTTSSSNTLTVGNTGSEDRHIFLVKKIESNRDLVNLLSIGFRFAEPAFISKTMGEKLQVPAEYMLNYFKDMFQMTETAAVMYKPINPPAYSSYSSPSQNKNEDLRGGVFVGLYILIDDQADGEMPYIVIQKGKRYAIPMVQLSCDGETEAERKPTELSRQERNIVLGLSGQSLSKIFNYEAEILRNNKRRSSSTAAEEPPFSPSKSVGSSKTLMDVQASFSILSDSEHDHQEELHTQYEVEPTSTTMVRHQDMETQRFIKALEKAAKSLISMSSYGKPLASSARLYGDVIDIPAFSLRAGPCQLILFRAHIITPGTRFAINQTLTESIKCIPYPLYRSYAFYITDIAIEKYHIEQNKQKSPSNYLTQQRLYQSTAARRNDLLMEESADNNAASEDNNDLSLQENGSTALTTYKLTACKSKAFSSTTTSITPQQALSSLPPPPRAKRSKFTIKTDIAALDVNHVNKDSLPNMLKGAKPSSTSAAATAAEAPIVLNLLPASARFWWLNNIYEETRNM